MKGNRATTRISLVLLASAVMLLSALAGVVSVIPTPLAPRAQSTSAQVAAAPLDTGNLVQVAPASDFTPAEASGMGSLAVIPEADASVANALITVDVNLKPSASLSSFVDQASNPSSPAYRQFLSAAAISTAFGASPTTYSALEAYFDSFGLSVSPSFEDLALSVTGTGAQLEAAFHTQLGAFKEQYTSNGNWIPSFGDASAVAGSVTTGPTFYANSLPAELPSALEQSISGVVGLNGLYAEPDLALPSGMSPGTAHQLEGAASASDPALTLDTIQSLDGANFTWTNLTPTWVCAYYDMCGLDQELYPSTLHILTGAENLWDGASTIGGAPDRGQGVTIAVVEVGCAIPSDLQTFSNETFGSPNQLMDRLTQIAVNDPSAIVPNTNLSNCIQNGEIWGWTGETELDIEYIAALAPAAHIDVIGDPSAAWITNPDDYLKIAAYLTTDARCDLRGSGMKIVEGNGQRACSISITSNSYQIGEQWAYFLAAPEYITVEDEDLLILNAEGVTNFFASGDGGSNGAAIPGWSASGAGVPSASPGSTAVGGGQLTALGPNGQEFPSGPMVADPYDGFNWTVAPAQAVASFTYWSAGPGSLDGESGGGFGASIVESQPWWENGLDTYSAGVTINPIVAGAAAFNMSLYSFGGWDQFFGGTSFATPITAGEFALIEEQANVAFGSPKLGDVNPALFAAHNAQEAGIPFASADAYVPMENIGTGDDYAPQNPDSWYFFNLSVNEPSDPVLPLWYPTLANPAGPGWNFLQGLGMPNATVLDNELIGTHPSTQHGLLSEPYSIEEVVGSTLVPFTGLSGGTTYTLAVVPAHGAPTSVTVQAYSGGANTGQYGGGTVTSISTSSTGRFTYTPTYATPAFPTNASEYGYFIVQGGGGSWAFMDYAVDAPAAHGFLSLCVTDAYGICQWSMAEVPMFQTVTTFPNGSYNLFGSATVELNGVALANAVVTQVTEVSQVGLFNPYLPPSSYVPGTAIGHTISDARGNALFYTAPQGLAEIDGQLDAQVYTLQATYDGLTSNSVMVFVEPQSGSTQTNLHYRWGSTISGTVLLSDLKYVDFLNVSIGSAPGQFENFTCPLEGAFDGVSDGFSQPAGTVPFPGGICQPFYDSDAPTSYEYPAGVWHPGIWESGILNALIPVSLSVRGLHWNQPIVLTLLAGGTNDLSFTSCSAGSCSTTASVQYPMYWADPTVFQPPAATPWYEVDHGALALGGGAIAAVLVGIGALIIIRRRGRTPPGTP